MHYLKERNNTISCLKVIHNIQTCYGFPTMSKYLLNIINILFHFSISRIGQQIEDQVSFLT